MDGAGTSPLVPPDPESPTITLINWVATPDERISGAPDPAVVRPKNDAVEMFWNFERVTAPAAIVATNEPVPDPVTSPVSVIVWSPVLVPEDVPENVPDCVARVPSPSVVLCAAASTPATSDRPCNVNVASAAVPDPVKYGSLSAALTSPAIAPSSASAAW